MIKKLSKKRVMIRMSSKRIKKRISKRIKRMEGTSPRSRQIKKKKKIK